MFSCILFDLDGTISDPKQGICGCVQYALRSFGIEESGAGSAGAVYRTAACRELYEIL